MPHDQLIVQPDHGGEDERGVGGGVGEQGVVEDEAAAGFAEPGLVAEFDVGAGFARLIRLTSAS